MTIRAIVVDDEQLPRERIVGLVKEHPSLELVGEADDGRSALDVIVTLRPDLVFLDIQIPELDGFQVIAALDDDTLPAIVFVTAYDEYAIRAFEVGAVDYLLKPVSADRFAATVDRVLARVGGAGPALSSSVREAAAAAANHREALTTRFVARRGAKHYFVPVADIDWIEAEGNYVRLQTATKSHLIRETMKGIEARLDPTRFERIHRSTIVAIDRVESIQARENGEYTITMPGGRVLISSRPYADRIRRLLR